MKRTGAEQGFSLVELLVSLVMALIIVTGAISVLTSFYHGDQRAQRLANRVATASTMASLMDHTLGMQGYYDAVTSAVAPIPEERPAPSVSTGSSVGPVNGVTVYWLPSAATTSPYCQGTLSATPTGMDWSVSGPSGCTPPTANSGSVFYPVGAGWAFYLVSGTDCDNNQVGQSATAVVASNASNGTEAASCLGNT